MPVVFSPGEPETRPLRPTEIVYTTAQKVADLLGIGPQEAVLMAANAEANAVFVTGTDYRETGFSVGDTILIYSDADPMGLEREITTITSTTSGVKLAFSSSINPGLYETTDNGHVQNQASFTNGKIRGMKRSHVEQRIKEVQDRIDNVTHNAWRPYLVSDEYLNFDTYKPYRRRYFTDYVGTTPLLFRNIQQILRLEMWQGENYREIGSAEARLEIADYTALENDLIALSPGGGGFAQLKVGTGSAEWDSRFDKVSTAQSLADLINKEDRVNKSAVPFTEDVVSGQQHKHDGVAFTLPLGSTNTAINVDNEFFASANSDYGNGKLKITSMRQTKGGESATIAVTDSTAMVLSDMDDRSGNPFQYNGSGVWLAGSGVDTNAFADYGVATASADGRTTVVFGYTGKTASSFTGVKWMNAEPATGVDYTIAQKAFQSDIGAFSDAGGDQARLKDWWLDSEMGIIYFNNSYPFFEFNAIKVSYIYGERYVEQAIEEAATKMVAVDLLMADDRSVLIPEGSENIPLAQKATMWKQESEAILRRYIEVVVFE